MLLLDNSFLDSEYRAGYLFAKPLISGTSYRFVWLKPGVGPESAEATLVTTTTGVISDALFATWQISVGGQVIRDGVIDGTTSTVIAIAYHNHQVYQENNASQWFVWNGSVWTATTKPF